MLPTIKNLFWKDVVTDWALLSQKQQITTNSDIFHSCLWYNSKTHKGDVFLPSWFNKGIYLIGDILLSDGEIIEKAEIELKYDFKINCLNYFTVRSGLNDFLKQYWCKDSTTCNYTRPSIPTHIEPPIRSHNSCKHFLDPIIAMLKKSLKQNGNLFFSMMKSSQKIFGTQSTESVSKL